MKTKNRLLVSVLCLLMVAFCVVGLISCSGDEKKCSHSWGDWSGTKAATCTEAGAQERTCSKCGEKETSAIEALGHDWNEATCSTPKTCKNCSATEGTALAHVYTVEAVKDEAKKSPATCDSVAVYYKSCACGAISSNDSDTFTSGSALEHKDENHDHSCDNECGKNDMGAHEDQNNDHACDYGCGVAVDSCFDAENDGDHNCDKCGNADVSAHNYTGATCGTLASCCECGATTGNTLEHKDENHDHSCDNNCGKNDMGACEDSSDDDDHLCDYGCGAVLEGCSDKSTDGDHDCDVCGKANVSVHNYEIVTSSDATCESEATNTYACDCGDSYDEIVGDALGHDIEGVSADEKLVSGCEYVLVYICQREECGEEVVGETVYNHNHIATIKTEATCTTDGLKTFKCACGDEKDPEVIPADSTGHHWIKGEAVDGVRIDTCSVCATTKTVTVYSGTVTDSINAGDLADKEIELNDTNISLDSGVIDKIGNQNVTVSADKLEGDDRADLGLSADQLAQVGNNPIYNFTINNGSENISDFGESNWVTITLPYTLADGEDVDSIAIWFINDKGELESIEAIYNNGYVTFKTNHFSYYTVTRLTPAERCELYGHGYTVQHVEGSCTKDSYDLYVCMRCHDKYVDNYVKADGHDYVAETHAATCTEDGYVLYTCEDCGRYYRTKLAATGHTFSIEEDVKSTCTAVGYVKYCCDNCDEEYTLAYAKVTHDYTSTVVPATCTSDGYTTHECNNCDYVYTDTYVDAIDHAYEVNAWTWAADNGSAVLTLVCGNDENHIMTLNATVETTVINGTCSNFVKTIYTATVSYGGVEYTDEKSIEEGTPDHTFSSDWSKDDKAHWHECVCGEKTDVSDHVFENATTTKEPTCIENGESTAYCVCGEAKTTVIPATGVHNYQDGICTGCGEEFVDTYYVDLVNSWKNIDGFAVKIQNFSYEVKEEDLSLIEAFKMIGSIKQIDIAEMALYVEDGELGGAAIGSVVIFNGPIANSNAVYVFKAVVQDGFIYINMEYGKDVANKVRNVKISVDELVESMLDEMGVDGDSVHVMEFIKDTMLPIADTLVEMHEEEVNEILKNAFNIMFTFEQQEDGSYVATVDYEKLYALNENLATKPVAEVVDIYFGEGTFDDVVEWMLEMIDLEVSEIPGYLDENGVDSADLIKKLNELAVKMGAPEDYDIGELINDEEYEGVTLGMIWFGVEDDSYIESFNEIVDELREATLYELIDAEYSEDVKDSIDEIIDLLSGSASISFVTDRTGMLVSINVDVDGLVRKAGRYETSIDFDLDIIVNGRIEVTWYDIIEEVEAGIILPEDEMLEDDMYAYCNYGYSGHVIYQGEEYIYSNGLIVYAYKTLFDQMAYITYGTDCSGWIEYEACYAQRRYQFTIASITVDGEIVSLIIDNYTGDVVSLEQTALGFIATFEDGTEKEIVFDIAEDVYDMAEAYTELYFAIFEDPEGRLSSFGDYVGYYYNADIGKYAYDTHHEFEYEYEVAGDYCEKDGRTTYVTCKNCDYYEASTTYWCAYDKVEIELSEHGACDGTISVYRCEYCGHVEDIYDMDISCDMSDELEEDILDDAGEVVGYKYTAVCVDCGFTFVQQEWTDYHTACEYTECVEIYIYKGEEVVLEYSRYEEYQEHEYEFSYELLGEDCYDGYIVNAYCHTCGLSYTERRYGHHTEQIYISLGELGLCGGEISEWRCAVCDEMMSSNVSDYWCNWQYVEENADGYKVYQCSNCHSTKLVAQYIGEKDEDCRYTVTQINKYIVNGEEVYVYENFYMLDDHNYEYNFIMNGTSCTDGYTRITFCKDCGYSYEGTYNEHYSVTVFELGDEYDCCDKHYVNVESCPCGYYYYVNFDYDNLSYDSEEGMYVCDDCSLTISSNVYGEENGCTITETTRVEIVVLNEVIYSHDKEQVYANHKFTGVETETVDGVTCVITTCDECEEVLSTEILKGYAEYHESNGEEKPGHYYDYVVTPEASGSYAIMSVANSDTYVMLYRMNGKRLEYLSSNDDGNGNGQFYLAYNLKAGETYVYRIGFYGYDEEGEIGFVFSKGAADGATCKHNYKDRLSFSALVGGADSCEDGVYFGYLYSACGCVGNLNVEYYHREVLAKRIDLSEHGACYGEIDYYSCACGGKAHVETNFCGYQYNQNAYYEDGRLITVETYTCSKCDMRYTYSYYTEKDRDNCTLTSYCTVVVNVGSKLVAEFEYESTQIQHDYEITTELMNGEGSSCEDGVYINYTCVDCGYTTTDNVYYHREFEIERIDLAELGNACGGYATVYGCACGHYKGLNLEEHSLCEFGSEWHMIWIEDVINEGQYTINGWNDYGYSSYLYTCAVTDPEMCAFKVRYASYWLKAEDECAVYHYETWQFGYDEETDTCLYELTYRTSNSRIYHNYVDESTENHTMYGCPDCGSYYREDWYYESGVTRYEKTVLNTLNNGYNQYLETVEEYTSDSLSTSYGEYTRWIDANGKEHWCEELQTEWEYYCDFGTNGREGWYSFVDSDGSYEYREFAYVYCRDYAYQIYTYVEDHDSWYRYDYTYTFANGCVRKTEFVNSYGESWTEEKDYCRFYNWTVIEEPTCSQDGLEGTMCVICGKHGDTYPLEANDHNWVHITDNHYYCFNCGLENTNGVSGDVILEDLTNDCGGDLYYVVGYYVRNNVNFTYYVSLILEDGTEVPIWDGIEFVGVDGKRAVAFNRVDVEAWATENGYTDYDIRFSFVPDGADGSFDYGITFTETIEIDTIVGSVSFSDYVPTGETKKYTITPIEDGVWTFTSVADYDTYACLYDANGECIAWNDDSGYNANFRIVYELKAGETYTIEVMWYGFDAIGNMPLIFYCEK